MQQHDIVIKGACEHNLKSLNLTIKRSKITIVTGVSGSGKSSLVFDTILAEAQRRFFFTLSHYTRQFLEMSSKPKVQYISGLSPAISVAQNETLPSKRATVGSMSDISELLGVLYARFGEKYCPKHHLRAETIHSNDIVENLLNNFSDQMVLVAIPFITDKKGHYSAQLARFFKLGFQRAYIDGKIYSLVDDLELDKSKKHTIKIIVDVLNLKSATKERFDAAIKLALEHGEGNGELWSVDSNKNLNHLLQSFSTNSGCPKCGYSWPVLDSRYFSANSLGKCKSCEGWGKLFDNKSETLDNIEEDGSENHGYLVGDESVSNLLNTDNKDCESCRGTGIENAQQWVKINDIAIHDLYLKNLKNLKAFIIDNFEKKSLNNPAFLRVYEQLLLRLDQIAQIGLGYVTLHRRILTLSSGEYQRLRLANVFGQSLRGVLYILDEPSQGLHPSEIISVWQYIQKLKDNGNTVVIIDHDKILMSKADVIIDLGPGGGSRGGEIMATFTPDSASSFSKQSITAHYLSLPNHNEIKASKKDVEGSFLEIIAAKANNLNIPNVKFKLGALNVVSGVSGAGKSSLVLQCLFQNLLKLNLNSKTKKSFKFSDCQAIKGYDKIKYIHQITRSPISRSTISVPATYLNVLGDIRDLYASLPQSQIAGLTAKSFSMHSEGGRCEACKGRGVITLSMRFLPDAKVICDVCMGERFSDAVLSIKYSDFSLNDLLEMTIDQVFEVFKNHKSIIKKIQPAIDLGLGYLKFGQPTSSLSGGEAQRLKLSPFIQKKHGPETLIVLEEPTMGLHFKDVENLIKVLDQVVEKGSTVILIEHNEKLIATADWLIDLGPKAAEEGGRLLYQGHPSGLAKSKESVTKQYL